MSDKPFVTGQCLCGGVKYTVSAEPTFMAQCHCKHCQRISGTGHVSMAFFKKEAIEIEGRLSSYDSVTDSGNTVTRHFCPTCGGRLFNDNSANPETRGITAGSADDNSWFSPSVVLYTNQRHAWDITTDGVPNFDEMPTK